MEPAIYLALVGKFDPLNILTSISSNTVYYDDFLDSITCHRYNLLELQFFGIVPRDYQQCLSHLCRGECGVAGCVADSTYISPLSHTQALIYSSFTQNLRYLSVFWHLVFEMGGIALDKAILISMILESLLYGSRPKSSSSRFNTNKLGSGVFTVMFGFTLWVLIHERSNRINMRLLLPALVLYALATAVSQLYHE